MADAAPKARHRSLVLANRSFFKTPRPKRQPPMPIVAAALALAALVWGAIIARRGSLLVGCGLLLVVSYALGHEFWHARIGPLPITFDRALLIGLLAAFAMHWRFGSLSLRSMTGSDWALVVILVLLCASAALSGQPDITDGVTSKWGRLMTSFVLPAIVYVVVRQLPIVCRDWSRMLAALVALGIYLAGTSICEVSGLWTFVFPRYIADPSLGIHFGRARGPELNSVSLGLYLTACCLCAWTLLADVQRRWQQLVLLLAMPLMAFGVLLTYTRSTWIGFAASALVVAGFHMPRRLRLPALAGSVLVGLLVAAVSWNHLMDLKREGTTGDSEHSVDQRASFAYVSWQMFCDRPICGVGFGRFYDRKLPYLSDRSQQIELESIRGLHHHNTLLSVLTETGLVGLTAFVAVFLAWGRTAWRLATNMASSPWIRAQGVLMLALIANYLSSAAFHDLTLLPSQELLLFVFAALTVNLYQSTSGITAALRATGVASAGEFPRVAAGLSTATASPKNIAAQIHLFGMQISRISMADSVATLLDWCRSPRGESCRFIVTPNTDHAVMFQHRADLRAAYADASLVLADGMPLVLAAKLFGQELPERVAGSDLVPNLFGSADRPLRVFLLGAAPGVADQAAARIHRDWSSVNVVGTYSPPIGFENDAAENARIFSAMAAVEPDLVIVGLGAPRQEIWVHRHRHELPAKFAICAGATIDFLAGHRRRSPVWMRRLGLEWFHRVCAEPRRLAGRYARDAWVLPQLLWREWTKQC
jgi:exopolysaccharide biosynthesis WecB/TagA/CpsF family protein